jgi:hypothetical protein
MLRLGHVMHRALDSIISSIGVTNGLPYLPLLVIFLFLITLGVTSPGWIELWPFLYQGLKIPLTEGEMNIGYA